MIDVDDLPDEVVVAAGENRPDGEAGYFALRDRQLATFEHDYLRDLLKRHQGDVRTASREAKLPRGTLYRLMKKHGLDGASFRVSALCAVLARLGHVPGQSHFCDSRRRPARIVPFSP